MSWCPFAVKMELQPESDAQAAITPTQFIAHSIAAPWTIERIYEYWRDSTNLESHFGVGYDGRIGQYIGTQTRADANYQANVRAISAETASNLEHTDPWNNAQLDSLVAVMDWAARTHGIPRRKCRSWTDPGFGYHRMFPEWSLGGTECPGNARAAQFDSVILPRLIAAGQSPIPVPPTAGGSEVTSIQTKNTSNSIDTALLPGVWIGLAFGGTDPAVLLDGGDTGKNVISQDVHLSLVADPDALITGAFYLTNPDGVTGLSGYQEIGPVSGCGGVQFHHAVSVPAGRHLRFRVKADRVSGGTDPLVLLHRTESSRCWEA
jgi:N-acetylmuramoyl-L-alanine amidase-like protein